MPGVSREPRHKATDRHLRFGHKTRRPGGSEPPGRARSPRLPDPTIGYLAAGGLPPAVLARASEDARRLGVSADAALLATGMVGEDDIYRALARHVGAAFVTKRRTDRRQAPITPPPRRPGSPRCNAGRAARAGSSPHAAPRSAR